MASVLEADAEVCGAIQRFQSMLTKERRRSPRRAFPSVRYIAQSADGEMPEKPAFFPVECRDLSTHGFSFLFKTRTQFQTLVLALDAQPTPIYLVAEVRHCTDVLVYPSGRIEVRPKAWEAHESQIPEGAEPWVLVGCEFTRRLPGNQQAAI